LNGCRQVTNIVGDAALYEHLQGDDHEAIELTRDLLHVSDLLRGDDQPGEIVRFLVSVGIQASALYRIETITSAVGLSDDPNDRKALQVRDARSLVRKLLEQPGTEARLRHVYGERYDALKAAPALADNLEFERAVEQCNRAMAECQMAAMSLACHLFRHEQGRWPANGEELATQLPTPIPRDPWGDGKQTLGYVLVKGGLPDGTDRPLVYSRCESDGQLCYRVDRPAYDFYQGDGSGRPYNENVRGGQFRDVARWQPGDRKPGAPTIRSLDGDPADTVNPNPAP
jgi:hypothetical protein